MDRWWKLQHTAGWLNTSRILPRRLEVNHSVSWAKKPRHGRLLIRTKLGLFYSHGLKLEIFGNGLTIIFSDWKLSSLWIWENLIVSQVQAHPDTPTLLERTADDPESIGAHAFCRWEICSVGTSESVMGVDIWVFAITFFFFSGGIIWCCPAKL